MKISILHSNVLNGQIFIFNNDQEKDLNKQGKNLNINKEKDINNNQEKNFNIDQEKDPINNKEKIINNNKEKYMNINQETVHNYNFIQENEKNQNKNQTNEIQHLSININKENKLKINKSNLNENNSKIKTNVDNLQKSQNKRNNQNRKSNIDEYNNNINVTNLNSKRFAAKSNEVKPSFIKVSETEIQIPSYIHRNPLCGRNFEYFSEDPFLSCVCAYHEMKGVQSFPGLGVTIKHFFCNNQEDNRCFVNEHVNERAIREFYLSRIYTQDIFSVSTALLCFVLFLE